jgi:hypothetical protein
MLLDLLQDRNADSPVQRHVRALVYGWLWQKQFIKQESEPYILPLA